MINELQILKLNLFELDTPRKSCSNLNVDADLSGCLLNRDDYTKKFFDISSDTSKFKKLPADPTLLREGQLQRFLRKLKKKQFLQKKFI